jgi:C-terminal processing protease CtpA/Prc
LPGGIRLSVARFFSPSNQPYNGRGVTPHVVLSVEGEEALEKAKLELLKLLNKPMPMAPMPDSMPPATPSPETT